MQTEQNISEAWRKRAEQDEAEKAALTATVEAQAAEMKRAHAILVESVNAIGGCAEERTSLEFLASLPEEIRLRVARLTQEREEARYSPTGDNHHNAAKCPYCNPEYEKIAASSTERRG